ncbi:MAG: serine/threonine protein kinase [Deltaproteobacteria bacterium]|nr:serine/threonine protein kinase [Deltaproteobacteria bacterium]
MTIQDHPLATQFNRLTPEQVLDAVEVGGRRCTGRFLALNSYENRVYQFELEDDSWVVGKFYRPGRWSRKIILAEHGFLAELNEVEIPVACPLDLGGGETLGVVGGIFFSLFPRIGGRSPQELNDDQLRILGRLLGRIHNVGAGRETTARMKLLPGTYGQANLDFLRSKEIIPAEARDIYVATVEMLLRRIEPLFLDVPLHRIHGDCHLSNLIETSAGPTFLDFDDMVVGPAVQDVWMLVPSFDGHGQAQRETLLEAYVEFREFKPGWLRLIEPLRALRYIHYATWIARRWQDPAFQQTFVHFGTIQYWQKEILDLREQIARLDHEVL